MSDLDENKAPDDLSGESQLHPDAPPVANATSEANEEIDTKKPHGVAGAPEKTNSQNPSPTNNAENSAESATNFTVNGSDMLMLAVGLVGLLVILSRLKKPQLTQLPA